MPVALDNDGLTFLRTKLKNGEYDGADIMRAWLAIDELRELRVWRAVEHGFMNPPASAVPQWQPIETAPKDKFLLLACPSGYTTTPWVFTTGIMHSDYKVGRWIDHANDDLTDWGMEPKFWMPLPAAPKETT